MVSAAGSSRAGAAAGAQAECTAAGASEVAVAGVATRGSEAAVESEAAGGSDATGGNKAVGGEGAVGVSAEARVRLYQPACEEFEVQSIEVSWQGGWKRGCESSRINGAALPWR